MLIKMSELRCKEVICVADGRRLGFVTDAQIDVPEGTVKAIIVPGLCRVLGMCGRKDDYCIPWNCIRHIGPDIILVDTKPDDFRVPRHKLFLL